MTSTYKGSLKRNNRYNISQCMLVFMLIQTLPQILSKEKRGKQWRREREKKESEEA